MDKNLVQTNLKNIAFFLHFSRAKDVIPCGTKFLQVLIFAIFAVFHAIRKNNFPQIKITANIFPAKINSRVLQKNPVLRNRVCSITSCLIHSETTKDWFIAWKYVFLLDVLNKNENIINAGYWLKLNRGSHKSHPSRCMRMSMRPPSGTSHYSLTQLK